MSHETEIVTDEWVAARDEIRRLRTVNAALLEALEGLRDACRHATFDNGVTAPDGRNEGDYWASNALDQARAAIALAKGEKP